MLPTRSKGQGLCTFAVTGPGIRHRGHPNSSVESGYSVPEGHHRLTNGHEKPERVIRVIKRGASETGHSTLFIFSLAVSSFDLAPMLG